LTYKLSRLANDWYGVKRGAYGVLLGESARKKLLGRPRRRWEDNIQMNFKEIPVGHGPELSDSE
jgi:hypothetical protein